MENLILARPAAGFAVPVEAPASRRISTGSKAISYPGAG
jgi:hypothetical protein